MHHDSGERLFEAIFSQAAVGMAHVDLSGRWIRVNQKLCDIVGYPQHELQQLSFQQLSHPDDLQSGIDAMRRLIDGQIATYTTERRYIHKSGKPIWVNLTVGMGRDPVTAEPEWFIAVIEDITDRKAAAHALQEQETFLKGIYEGVEQAIFVWDVLPEAEFRFVGCNPSYERLTRNFGMDIPWMVGRPIGDLTRFLPESVIAEVRGRYLQCVQSAQAMEYDESAVIDGKLTHWFTRLTPLSSPDGAVHRIIGTTTNVTSQREAVERILATEDALRQAQKMEAVGRLAGGIAHDFNNLLTAISGYGDLLLTRVPATGVEHDYLHEIRLAGERAAALTHQLLAFSRKQVLSATHVDLNAVVVDMGNLLRRLIGEDITLETRLTAGPIPIFADRGQIEQVILNLCLNARDALVTVTPRGQLTIETACVEIGNAPIGLDKPLEPGAYAMLSVSDNGKGMDAETRARIFEPFFTTKAVGEGTGLGLATVYGIVAQSGGVIQVYSEPGHGAVFKVYLPLSSMLRKDSIEPVTRATSETCFGTETILVAEDEPTLRKLIATILTTHGYTVISAQNGTEALQAAAQHAGTIHLLLTDVVMKQMGGRELSEALRARRPAMKLIYMSGYTDDTVVRHGILDATMEFLHKPFAPEDLLRRIRRVLDA